LDSDAIFSSLSLADLSLLVTALDGQTELSDLLLEDDEPEEHTAYGAQFDTILPDLGCSLWNACLECPLPVELCIEEDDTAYAAAVTWLKQRDMYKERNHRDAIWMMVQQDYRISEIAAYFRLHKETVKYHILYWRVKERYDEGLTDAEIAHSLNLPVKKVAGYVHQIDTAKVVSTFEQHEPQLRGRDGESKDVAGRIKYWAAQGVPTAPMAERFNLSKSAIKKTRSGKRFPEVPMWEGP